MSTAYFKELTPLKVQAAILRTIKLECEGVVATRPASKGSFVAANARHGRILFLGKNSGHLTPVFQN